MGFFGKKVVAVPVAQLRAILVGFVDFQISGDEASEAAFFLTQKWNATLFQALAAMHLRPDIALGGTYNRTLDGVLSALRETQREKYPECGLVLQHGGFVMARRSGGAQQSVTVVLATFFKSDAPNPQIVAGAAQDFNLSPA